MSAILERHRLTVGDYHKMADVLLIVEAQRFST
jgi:hypothetical protein